MGWAIPAAIGGKLASPQTPVVVITGDGCMHMHGIEIATAARYKVPVIVVVSNNGALGNVYMRARKANPGAAEMTLLPMVDWAAFARVFGAGGRRVEQPDDLAPALREALASGGPFVIDALTQRDDVRRVRTRSRRLIGIEEMSTLPDPTGQLSPEARQIYEQIVGVRSHDYPGLFRSLMNYPELAQRFAEFGNLLRFDGILRADARELAILTVARELRIAYIWETHQENAAKAGLSSEVVADVLAGRDLAARDKLFSQVQQLVKSLLQLSPVPQTLQDQLVAALSLPGFIQLSVVIGYYRMIAGLTVGFEFPPPPGMSDPFQHQGPNR
jgi:alkylhydroperoxidase family enzyme